MSQTSGQALLSIRDLKKQYDQPGGGELTILDVPALDVGAGEQVVLRGESGSGKTTLLHVISGDRKSVV